MFTVMHEDNLCNLFPLPNDEKSATLHNPIQNDAPLESDESSPPINGGESVSAAQDEEEQTSPSVEISEEQTATSPVDSPILNLPLDNIFIDASIFPRAAQDEFTVQRYVAALIRGEILPLISVEATKTGWYRVLKGVHRYQAYRRRRDIYAEKYVGDFYETPLPPLSEAELNTIPCVIETMPPDMHPMVFCMLDNFEHGKPLTPEDYKRVARQLYKDREGAAISTLAKLIRIDRKTFKAYVADLVEAFEAKRETIIHELHDQGASNQEISDELKEQFRDAKGNGKSQVGETVSRIAKETQSVEEKSGPETDDTDPPPAPPVDTVQDPQDPPEKEHEEPESEEPEIQHEAPTPTELKVTAGTSGDAIMILGVHSLPDHLQDRLRKAVNELVEQIRIDADKDKEQETDPNETPSPDTAEHDLDNDEADNHKDEPAKPDNEIRKFVPAIQPSRGSRPVSYPV